MPISLEELNRQFPSHGSNYNDEVRVDQAGWGDRFGASVDRAQSQLLGVGEALGLDLGDARRDNQIAAEIQRSRAVRDTGATDNWRDINGVGSFGSFVGGMAVDSAPELLTSVASGGAGALAGLGTLGRLGLAAATNAPAALGDILQNQREESGRTNLASAIPLTAPYVAADLLGLDAALASGKAMRTGLRSLDQMTGARGLAARTAANAGLNFLAEGTGETGQEFVNQFGRMTVNPDQTVFNHDANERYVDSFVGGGLLGGSVSSVMGGWRRSEGYQPKGVTLPSDQSVDDPSTPADLLGGTQNQTAPALGFSGYNTGVGELVSFPDGSVMLRSEYEARRANGLAPDGSVEFVPPAMSDVMQRRESYQYEGAVPFEVIPPNPPGVMPTERPAPLSQVPVAGIDGNQLDLFSPQVAPLNQFSQLPQAQEITATPRDTLTRDMLVESPTAMVPTMFNPLNESQQVGSRGAVAGNIRSQLSQQLGGAGDMTVATQLSLDIAGNLGNLGAMTAAVDARQQAIEKNLVALDRKVSGDSNMLSPDEYATRREALENKLLTVEAARTLLTHYQQAQTNAYADEARGRGQPGQTVGTVPESNATETEMRDNSMRAAVAETDARVQQGEMDRRQDDQAKDRMAVLRQVLSEPTRSKPVARFRKALRDAGFTNLDVTPAEQVEIDRVSSRRADVRDATVVPPGLAAANNLLIPRSTFDGAVPSPTPQDATDVQNQPQPVAATTGAEAVSQPAQAATAMGAQPASQATRVPAARTTAVETSGVTNPALVGTIPSYALYQVTEAPADRNVEPLAREDAEFELSVLEQRAAEGKLTPEVFARSDVAARLDASTTTAINDGLRRDPVGTVKALRVAFNPTQYQRTPVSSSGRTGDGGYAPQQARQQITVSPAYPNLAPMSAESADAELQALEVRAANGALSPEIFGRSEVAKRLGADVVAQIGAGIERDPMGAIRGLRQAVAPTSAPVVSQPAQAPVVSQPGQAPQAVGAQPAGTAYFSTKEKAADFVAKSGIKDTHEVVQTGKVRFEVMPKVEGARQTKNDIITERRVTYEGKPATLEIIRKKDDPTNIDGARIKVDGERLPALNLGAQGPQTDDKFINGLIETEIINGNNQRADGQPAEPFEHADIAAEETPPTNKAKPKRASKKVAIESSVQDLTDAVDAATDELEYDGAVDALYRRYMEGSDADTDAVLDYVQAQPKSFSKDWSAAEKRYDDTERGVTGTRGLAQKNDAPTSEQIKKSVESDMLRGVWTRFSQGAVQPAGKSVSLERVQQIVQQVLGKLGIAGVVQVEAFRNPTDANLTTPDGVVPAGVTLNGGRILLFADNIGSEIDVFRTLFHELFHLGLSKSLGQTAYIQQMLKFKLDPLVNKYALRWKGTADGRNRKGKLPVNNYEALAVEEALADIAEDLATDKLGSKELQPFVRSMVGKLASIAQAVGLDKVAQALRRMTYTQAEKFVMDTVLGANYAAPTQLRGKRFSPGTSAAGTEAELRALDKEGGTPAAMVERLSKTPMGYMVRNTLGSWRKRHGVLGWLTMDQIKDRFAEFPAVVKAADKVLFMGSRANALLRSPTALHRQWAKFARENKGEVANNLNNLFIRSTLAEAWVDGDMEPRLDPRNKHIDFTDPKKAAAVAKARTLYVSLPKEGQEIYKRVTAELDKQFRAKQEAILKRVVDVYRDSLAKVASPEELMEIARGGVRARANFRGTALPGMTMRERLEFQKFGAALDSMYVPRNEVPGPYFPLTRRGDHVVVFKAKSYVALNKALEDARANLDKLLGEDVPLEDKALEDHSKRVADARKAVADARKAVEDAKGDGTQYVVKFFEGAAQAEDGAAELRKELGHLGEVTQTLRRAFTHNTDSVPAGFMAKLQDQMVKSLPEDSREDVASAVRQMIIQSLPERSAFKAELKRMRVEGVDPVDAMYSFVSASSRNAWTTSRLENATDLAEAMVEASSSDNYDERIVGNELVKRYAQSLEYKESHALIDAASNLSYITNLGFSPGYYMQNMLQPWMISLPVMAGRFGVRNASTAMSDATVDVVKAIHATIKEGKVNGNWEMPLDLSKFSKTEQELLERMVSEGRIDITMRADMGSGSTATGEVGHYLQRASELSSLPAHMVEVTNRVATALAAFRLVQRSGGNVDEALAYAEKVVVQTHVDYSVENAPRFMRPSSMGGFGKLAFQFKRYQQAMVFLWFKLVIDSVRHGRKEDALALLYLSGSNFAMAGLSGLPIAAPMGLALAGLSAAFGDEEDEEDWGEMLWSGVRGVIGETATDVLRKGVPTAIGIDISSKVGQGSILSPIFKMPNANTGEGVVSGLGFQLVFGASGAMLGNWADAVMLSKDNPALAVQKLMPRGAKDFMEAVRRDYDGLTDRKGKVLLDEAEVDFGDTLVKALGLESVKVTNLYDRRSTIMDAEYARQDVRTRLMSKYTKARVAGDSEEMADIRSDIDAFNKRNPRDVQILPKNLVASYKQEMVRRREMQNGVRVTKRNRDIVEQYSAD